MSKQKNKKIAIITITDGANYGNRLQNYALQFVLKKLGFNVETIQQISSRDVRKSEFYILFTKNIIKRIIGRNKTTIFQQIRKRRFDIFNKKNIKFSSYIFYPNKPSKGINDLYDYFVFGSDQIWNTHFQIVKENVENYLGVFATHEKKVSYAASFGTSDIPKEYKEKYKKYLKDFKAISVRENNGVKIVKDLSGREDVHIVVDPTMLLTASDWKLIEKKPKVYVPEKYFLTYFINAKDDKIKKRIKFFSDKAGVKTIDLMSEFLFDAEVVNKNLFITDPAEFIWLLSHSLGVITDSYHATVFSIIFEKPFSVYGRKGPELENDMSSRIISLLENLKLMEYASDNLSILKMYDINTTNKLLDEMRSKSIHFLIKATFDDR